MASLKVINGQLYRKKEEGEEVQTSSSAQPSSSPVYKYKDGQLFIKKDVYNSLKSNSSQGILNTLNSNAEDLDYERRNRLIDEMRMNGATESMINDAIGDFVPKKDVAQTVDYSSLVNNADYEANKDYRSTKHGEGVRDALSGYMFDNGYDDIEHDIINKDNLARLNYNVNMGENLAADNGYLDYLEQNEVDTYNYLYNTQGKDKAKEYINSIKNDLYKRQTDSNASYWNAEMDKSPVNRALGSVESVILGLGRPLDTLGMALDYLQTGSVNENKNNRATSTVNAIRENVGKHWGEAFSNYYKKGKTMLMQNEGYSDEEIADELSKDNGEQFGNFAYQTMMSMADFLTTALATGNFSEATEQGKKVAEGLSLAIMGAGATPQTVIEAKERGADDGQALLLGAISGLAEVVTERVSVEALLDPNMLKDDAIKYIAKNFLSEGAEEVGSDLINLVADLMIMADKSELAQRIQELMKEGMSEGEAYAKALGEQALNMGADFLGGAISGGIMGASGVAINNFTNYRNGVNFNLQSPENMTAVLDEAFASNPEGHNYQQAMDILTKMQNDESYTPSAREMGELWQRNIDVVDKSEMARAEDEQRANEIIENMGNEGKYVVNNFSNPNADQVKYTSAMTDYYLGGMNGTNIEDINSVNGDVLNDIQKQAAYEAGINDKGANNNEGNISLSQSEERNDGTSAEIKIGGMAEESAKSTVIPKDSGAASLKTGEYVERTIGTSRAKFTTIVSGETESMKMARQIAKDNGMEVEFFSGIADVFDNGKRTRVRGLIHGNKIYVQVDHPDFSADQLAHHEVTHKKLNNGEIDKAKTVAKIKETYKGKEFDTLVNMYASAYNWMSADMTDEEIDAIVDETLDEMICDAVGGINIFKGKIKTSEKIYEPFLQNLKGSIVKSDNQANAPPTNRDTQMSREIEKRLSSIGFEYSKEDGNISFSQETFFNSDYVYNRKLVVRDMAKAIGCTPEEAGKFIDDVVSVAFFICSDKARLDYEDNPLGLSFLKPNSEYIYTVDSSTLCEKRLLYTRTFDKIQEALPNMIMTAEDLVRIREMMKEKKYPVACGICYVESSRKDLGKRVGDFITEYKKSQKTGKPIQRKNSSGEYKDLIVPKATLGKKNSNAGDKFYADKNFTPTVADFTTINGIESLYENHRDVYEAFLNNMNALGQSKPKLLETRAAYKGEIMSLTESEIKNLKHIGGLRFQSFSDFEVPHMIDNMQVILDASRKGLPAQAYTKKPAFAWVFGGTNMKINLSLIAKGSGLDKNGNLIFDDVEGMPIKDAIEIRKAYPENVGTILVGKNDAHILKAMADDRIDFIIPFHKSQWKESLYKSLGLDGYSDYTEYQNEKWVDGRKDKIKNLYPADYWDSTKSGKENAEIYLKRCAEEGRVPKFSNFLVDNGDGSWSLPPDGSTDGYWKLLGDYKMYDNDGNYAPQENLVPRFNMEKAEEILNNYKGDHTSTKYAEDVVDEFVKEKKASANKINFSQELDSQGIKKSEELAPTFYSHMSNVIDDIKQDKIGANSVVNYLKGKGVKDEEIKWSGIKEFLDGKKSVTKAELQEFAKGSMLEIEEKTLANFSDGVQTSWDKLMYFADKYGLDLSEEDYIEEMDGSFKESAFISDVGDYYNEGDITKEQYDHLVSLAKTFSLSDETKWHDYITDGTTNYREILFKLPNSDYSNSSMRGHWGEEGVLAHARIGDQILPDGSKMLFIEEIQSDWHNAALKKGEDGKPIGYSSLDDVKKAKGLSRLRRVVSAISQMPFRFKTLSETFNEISKESNLGLKIEKTKNKYYLSDEYFVISVSDNLSEFTENIFDYVAEKDYEANNGGNIVPDAPFKNYTDFVMKRLLRMAAEENYDYIGWTTGKMQEGRWSSNYAEGYKIEYDQDIPRFMNKYGKQWGVKVEMTPLGNVDIEYFDSTSVYDLALNQGLIESRDDVEDVTDNGDDTYTLRYYDGNGNIHETTLSKPTDNNFGEKVYSVPINLAMKESVLHEGQPMYSEEPTRLNDIQKENDNLKKEINSLKAEVDKWKSELRISAPLRVRNIDADTLAKKLIKKYSSKASVSSVTNKLLNLGDYMLNSNDEDYADRIKSVAVDVASDIVNKAEVLTDDGFGDIYNDLTKYARKGISISAQDRADIPDFNDFRKSNFGRLKITNDGIKIDSLYQELNGSYPDLFPSSITHPAEQLKHFAEVLNDIAPHYENPYLNHGIETAEVVDSIANEIIAESMSMKATKKTFADRQETKKTEIKSKADERIKKLQQKRNDDIAKLKAEYKDRAKAKRISTAEKQLRERIERHTKKLQTKLLSPTDKSHIPQAYQSAVARLLESINLSSTYRTINGKRVNVADIPFEESGIPTKRSEAFATFRKQYEEMVKDGYLAIDEALLGTDGLLEDVVQMGETPLGNLGLNELEKILTCLKAVEGTLNYVDKAFSTGKYNRISEVSEKLYNDNMGKNQKGDWRFSIMNNIAIDMLTPEAFFHRLGDMGDWMFSILRAAQDKRTMILNQAVEFNREALKNVKPSKMENSEVEVTLGGRNIKMSKADLMELYVLSKREKARNHILAEGIKLKEPSKKGLKTFRMTSSVKNITELELGQAFTKLTPEEIDIADTMQKFLSTTMAEYGNQASMEVYNYEKFNEDNYWRMVVDKGTLKDKNQREDVQSTSVANMGMTKPTVQNAKNPLMIGSIFDSYSEHIVEMANYSSYLAPQEDINRIRNFVIRDDEGNKYYIKNAISNAIGSKGESYLRQLMSDIANGVKSEQDYFGGLFGKYKAAAVGANLRVILQQPTAILRAMDTISPKYMFGGLIPQGGWKKAVEWSPIARWKDWGYFDINSGKQMKDVLLPNNDTLTRVQEWMMMPAGWADSIAWGQLWNAVELETRAEHKELEVGSREYYEFCAERFAKIIDHSQVVDGILQRSQAMRDKSMYKKMLTSFMGEPTKQYNQLLSAVYDVRQGKKNAGKMLTRTVFAMAIAGTMNALAQSIVDAMRHSNRDKDYWEQLLEEMTGIKGDEESIADYVKNGISGNLESQFNPLTYIIGVKDAWNIIEGYEVDRMDISMLSDLISSAKKMVSYISGESNMTWQNASSQLLTQIAKFVGLPVANIEKDFHAIIDSILINPSDDYALIYEKEKLFYDIEKTDKNYSRYSKILYEAYQNDRSAYEYIFNDLLSHGYDSDKLVSSMNTYKKNTEGAKSISDMSEKVIAPSKESKYTSTLNKITSSSVYKNATEEQKEDLRSKAYSYANGTSDSLNSAVEKAEKSGLSATDYMLYSIAKKMVDKPNKNGNLGTYTNDEKIAAARLVGIAEDKIRAYENIKK